MLVVYIITEPTPLELKASELLVNNRDSFLQGILYGAREIKSSCIEDSFLSLPSATI
jgi:hypothetical protein